MSQMSDALHGRQVQLPACLAMLAGVDVSVLLAMLAMSKILEELNSTFFCLPIVPHRVRLG